MHLAIRLRLKSSTLQTTLTQLLNAFPIKFNKDTANVYVAEIATESFLLRFSEAQKYLIVQLLHIRMRKGRKSSNPKSYQTVLDAIIYILTLLCVCDFHSVPKVFF